MRIGVGRTFYDFVDDLADNVRIGFQKIVAAHSGFAGQTGRDDNDV